MSANPPAAAAVQENALQYLERVVHGGLTADEEKCLVREQELQSKLVRLVPAYFSNTTDEKIKAQTRNVFREWYIASQKFALAWSPPLVDSVQQDANDMSDEEVDQLLRVFQGSE